MYEGPTAVEMFDFTFFSFSTLFRPIAVETADGNANKQTMQCNKRTSGQTTMAAKRAEWNEILAGFVLAGIVTRIDCLLALFVVYAI